MTAALWMLWMPIASAQTLQRPVPGPVLRMIEALDADDLTTREDATEALTRQVLRPSFVNTSMIHRLIADPDLSPEQRARLILVDRASFAQGPRAAMGIRFANSDGTGIGIGETFKKFPSYKVLQAGDVILTAGDEPMVTQDDLRLAILSRDPGELLPVTIQRGDEVIEIDVELGYYDHLDQPPLPERTLEMAWSKRVTRLWANAVIDAREATVEESEPESDDATWLGVEQTWDDQSRTQLAQGGGGRVVPDPSALKQRVATLSQVQVDALLRANAGLKARRVGNPIALALQQENALRASLRSRLDQLARPGLTAVQKQTLMRQVEIMQARIDRIEKLRNQAERKPKP